MSLRKSYPSRNRVFGDRHTAEHWYRGRAAYFITSRVRGGVHAFASEPAKSVFWDRFSHYTNAHGFEPWVVTLVSNHYHLVGYLERGEELGQMMRRLHGSVAKLVNDLLPERCVPFWRESSLKNYFDGCLRDENQLRRAYLYTLRQSVRHGIRRRWEAYPHTRVLVNLEDALRLAAERRVYMPEVPYKRYLRKPPGAVT